MSRLPLYTALLLAAGILAWNFSFYRELYQAHAAVKSDLLVEQVALGVEPAAAPAPEVAEHAQDGPPPMASPGRAPGGRPESRRSAASPAPPVVPARAAGGPPASVSGDDSIAMVAVTLYHASGAKRSEGQLANGLRVGLWTEYYEDGQRMSEGEYVDDLRDGHWRYWHPDGSKKHEGDYVSGQRHDRWLSWHDNGEVLREGGYDHGERVGKWRQFYSNGQVMEEGSYERGLREGWWQFFHSDGTTERRTGNYVHGRRDDR